MKPIEPGPALLALCGTSELHAQEVEQKQLKAGLAIFSFHQFEGALKLAPGAWSKAISFPQPNFETYQLLYARVRLQYAQRIFDKVQAYFAGSIEREPTLIFADDWFSKPLLSKKMKAMASRVANYGTG